MPLLTEITINQVINRISNEGLALTNWWSEKIISFDPPQYSLDYDEGGFCRMNYGGIELSPDLFSGDWPPPIKCPIVIKYTATTEAAAITLFTGTAQIRGYDRNSVKYELYGEDYTTPLLDEGVDFDGNLVPYPKAFGDVVHVTPVRVANQGGYHTYHKGGIVSTTPGSDFSVFDDGINNDSNVIDNGDGTFSVSTTPVGEVTMSGIGEDTSLDDVVQWACGATKLNLTYSGTYARTAQPDLNHWADSQTPLIDFLSRLCGFYTHLFYINDTTLNFVDMLKDNGSDTITEFQFFPSEFEYNIPLAAIRANWQTRSPATQTGSSSTGYYVGTYYHETQKLINIVASGTTDTTTANKLEDNNIGVDFVTDGVEIEMSAKNLTDNTETKVIAIDDANTLSVNSDIFVSGDDYEIGYVYPYGQDKTVETFTKSIADIHTELTNIMSILHKPRITLRMPLKDDLPVPGKKITLTDNSTVSATTISIRVRGITYDFGDEKVIITGEGTVS